MAGGLWDGDGMWAGIASAFQFQSVGSPPDYFFISLGLIIAGAFIFLAVKMGGKAAVPPSGLNRKRRVFRAVVVSAVFGLAAFMASGRGESWILAALIFYSEYFVRGRRP